MVLLLSLLLLLLLLLLVVQSLQRPGLRGEVLHRRWGCYGHALESHGRRGRHLGAFRGVIHCGRGPIQEGLLVQLLLLLLGCKGVLLEVIHCVVSIRVNSRFLSRSLLPDQPNGLEWIIRLLSHESPAHKSAHSPHLPELVLQAHIIAAGSVVHRRAIGRIDIREYSLIEALQTFLGGLVQVLLQLALLQYHGHVLFERNSGPRVLSQPVVASDDVLQQSGGRLVDLTLHHVVQHSAHCEEPFSRLTQVVQALFVQKDLLNYECGHSLG